MIQVPTDNSWKIFASARQFFTLVNLLTRTEGFTNTFPLGYFTNAAFTLELLLKCIISIEGKEYKKVHDLHSLFEKLSIENQKLILKHHRIEAKKLGKNGEEADKIFKEFITKASKDFVNARYFFDELTLPDIDGLRYFNDLAPLLQATYNAVRELKPEWEKSANVRVKNERKI
jgi:HEPN domain-containing protein